MWLLLLSSVLAGPGRDLRSAEQALQQGRPVETLRLTSRLLEAELSTEQAVRARRMRAEARYRTAASAEDLLAAAEDLLAIRTLDPEAPTELALSLGLAITARYEEADPAERVVLMDALVAVRDDLRSHTLRCLAVPTDRVVRACTPVVEQAEGADRPHASAARAVQRLVLERLAAADPSAAFAWVERGERLLTRQRALVDALRDEDADLLGAELEQAANTLELARLTAALKLPDQAPEAARMLEERLQATPDDPALHLALGHLQLERAARLQQTTRARELAGEVLSPAERTRIDMEAIGLYVEARDHLQQASRSDGASLDALLTLRDVLRTLGEREALAEVEGRLRRRLPALP